MFLTTLWIVHPGVSRVFGITPPTLPYIFSNQFVSNWVSHTIIKSLIGSSIVRITRAFDPNDMIGPKGSGPENRVEATEELPYTIRFENLPTATASAQVVRITQSLDEYLDPAAFAFGEYGWGSRRFQAPAGVTSFRERHDLRAELGLYVDVEAVYDPDTATLAWTFTAIDPRTMQVPSDDRGFLPVNTADHIGEGFVSYTVRARDTVQLGDVIFAQARIVFDGNEPIDTPLIFNTIGPRIEENAEEDVVAPAPASDPTGAADEPSTAPPGLGLGTELTTTVLYGAGVAAPTGWAVRLPFRSDDVDAAPPRNVPTRWFSPASGVTGYPVHNEVPRPAQRIG